MAIALPNTARLPQQDDENYSTTLELEAMEVHSSAKDGRLSRQVLRNQCMSRRFQNPFPTDLFANYGSIPHLVVCQRVDSQADSRGERTLPTRTRTGGVATVTTLQLDRSANIRLLRMELSFKV